MVHEGIPHDNEEALRKACIARGGTWENGVCFEAETPEEKAKARRGGASTREREELRQKQLREDPQFAADVALVEERRAGIERARAEERLITPEQRAIEADIQAQILQEPVRRELDPTVQAIETIPVIGPLLKKLGDLIPGFKERSTEIPLTPEELKTVALTEIERREIERGLTISEKFGAFVEAVPVGELGKYIPGLAGAERPSQNVQTIVKSLRQLKTRGRDIISNAESGDLTRSEAEERILVIEGELQIGESRIKMLIQNSPELKFNSDGVNFIEGRILEVRIILQDAKIAAIRGQVAESQMTGMKILESLEEDFTIPGL